jgi:formylglycine-generating enzyme required for sulfatase activity
MKTVVKIVVISALVLALAYLRIFNTSADLTEQEQQSAMAGVSTNADWLPISGRITGVEMQLVPAGCFTMGSTAEQLLVAQDSCDRYYGIFGCKEDFSIEQPAHEVCLSEPFWIDQQAISNSQYLLHTRSFSPSQYAEFNLPVQGVNWQAAADYCALRGGRLPTEAEWEFAARGPDALIFPYGNSYDITLSTLRKISPPQGGQIPEAASWVGALDMSGGQGEWVNDFYGPYPAGSQLDPHGPAEGEQRIARGGNWFAHAGYFVRSSSREALAPDFATSVTGMRCVVDFDH